MPVGAIFFFVTFHAEVSSVTVFAPATTDKLTFSIPGNQAVVRCGGVY